MGLRLDFSCNRLVLWDCILFKYNYLSFYSSLYKMSINWPNSLTDSVIRSARSYIIRGLAVDSLSGD